MALETARSWLATQRDSTIALFVAGTYLCLRLVGWVLSLPTIVGPDSHSYLPGPGLAVPSNWYVGFEKVSFLGDGAIRPWTVALPYALLLTDYFRSIFQLLVSIGAFLLLAAVLVAVVRPRALGALLALIALAFSCTTLVAGWDMLLNRESLSISLTVTFLALALLAARSSSFMLLLLVLINGLLLLVTRPTLAPLVGLVVLVLLIARTCRSLAARGPGATLNKSTVVRGIVALSVGVLMLAYPVAYSLRLDDSWDAWYGQTMSETQFGYVVADYNPQVGAVIAELEGDAPRCLIDELPVYTGEYVGAPWGFAAQMREECPGFREWYEANWPAWYFEFIARNPGYAARVGISGFKVAVQPWEPTTSVSPLPGPIRDAVFPVTTNDGLAKYDPLWFYWSVVASAAVVAVLRFRRSAWAFLRIHATTVLVIAAVVIGSLASILINLLLVPSYPLETNRINVSPTLGLRLTGVLLAVFAVWRLGGFLRRSVSPNGDQNGVPSP